jgi:hypothetical protein
MGGLNAAAKGCQEQVAARTACGSKTPARYRQARLAAEIHPLYVDVAVRRWQALPVRGANP